MLLFIDNIFRFTQAGSEVSALLGRIPSAVGYQPTLAIDMGTMQERITTTTKGSITSVQAVYVPADDLTDPAPVSLPFPSRLRNSRPDILPPTPFLASFWLPFAPLSPQLQSMMMIITNTRLVIHIRSFGFHDCALSWYL